MTTLQLELYVTGRSVSSVAAIANLERILGKSGLDGQWHLVIVDVLDQPDAAEAANIVATPTLIRRAPAPVRRLVGDLSPTDVVLRGLGLDHEPVLAADGGRVDE
jgi:circadian clock protein KaiB